MTAIDGRQAILARLAALGTAQTPASLPSRPAEVAPTADWDPASLVGRFVQALDRLQVTWTIAEAPAIARLTLVSKLQEEGVQRVLTWHASELPVGGLLEALEALGIRAITPELATPDSRLRPQDLDVRRRYLLEIESTPVGLTGADAAFASTGTLLLHEGPGRPLLVSQLPRRLVVLLPASKLYPTLESWQHRRAPGITSLLTGASRSSDIEVTPAFGPLGPSRLHVIVVQGC